ncbi:copper resistance protein CopC [Methylobacillus sp. Pita2]|uniref:copper resistance CopC family protein n=1 Tax=Methylobacillus sp. Pita2 TaxID=3383245 RepID=UPI0038B5AC39
MANRYLILCWLLLLPFSALGHSKLLSSDPEEGSVLSEPPTIVTLRFNKPIESRFNRAELWQGKQWIALPSEAAPEKLVIKLGNAKPLAEYRIRWSVMSHDGHRQQGILRFLVK